MPSSGFKSSADNVGKKSNQSKFSENEDKNRKEQNKNEFNAQAEKPKFQSEDSEGSDISYESSIESEHDIDIGRIDYFKEEMARFFINYPELINHDIIDKEPLEYVDSDSQDEEDPHQSDREKRTKKGTLNPYWDMISNQILNEAKDSSSFLESLSRRMALYRSKVQQEDIIDILLKEEKHIIKELDLQINQQKKEVKGNKNAQNIQGVENTYFSWRKKKQMENRLNLSKNNDKKAYQTAQSKPTAFSISHSQDKQRRTRQSSEKKFNKDKSVSKGRVLKNAKQADKNIFLTNNIQIVNSCDNFNQSRGQSLRKNVNNKGIKMNRVFGNEPRENAQSSDAQKENQSDKKSQNVESSWKHLAKFEPRTQAGRQLCQLIRKTNNPNDQLGIKKTIMTFLVRSKDMLQNEVILKSTISQKIQKLYNYDSKELLMFYPTKMNNVINRDSQSEATGNYQKSLFNAGNSQEENDSKIFEEGEAFLNVLDEIVEGPLMKYWMTLQENKL